MKKSFCLILLFAGSVSQVQSSCFGNNTALNSTTSPCHTSPFQPHLLPAPVIPPYPQAPYYPQVYPQLGPYDYSTGRFPPQQQGHGSNVLFPQTGYNTEYDPYYRPNENSRLGYTYPAGYRGPDWGVQYNNHLSQPPPRYTLGYGHPNLSPVAPAFQRRTYVSDYQLDSMREPIFMDMGTAALIGRDAELTCAFYDNRYKVVSNVAWVKVNGPYEHRGPQHPPFQCHRPGCQYVYLNSVSDFRFRVITLGQTSTLRIYDVVATDQGIYRCAATAQGPDGHTVTVYKIIQFFSSPMMQRPSHADYAGR